MAGAALSLLLAGVGTATPAAAGEAGVLGASCDVWDNGYTGYAKCWNGGSSKHRVVVTCRAWNSTATAKFYGPWYSSHYGYSEAKTSSYTCSTDGSRYVVGRYVENLTQS
ncbi:hypothetical protein [Streptomyces vilmorinianum]|uniref:hypothetical protein n=1 Tax=Streptomyces vilmorinianum TaxID=3051092 RepID=UPI0010FAEE43|nr:hypothetical protein [Streptomyces vilmorinianum]